MIWVKLTYATGSTYINLEQVYKIDADPSSPTLVFYDANSILPITYTFSTQAERDDVVSKFESISAVIDLDALAPQK